MPTTFCTRCTKEFDYNLPSKTKYVLCSYCGWGQNAASFWHSYWGGDYPELPILQNLSRWSRHLQGTAFLPILWTNRSAYQAVCENAERGSILTLSALCQQNRTRIQVANAITLTMLELFKLIHNNNKRLQWHTNDYHFMKGAKFKQWMNKVINKKKLLRL